MFSRLFRPHEYSQLSASCEENIDDGDLSNLEQKSISRPCKQDVRHASTQTLIGSCFTVIILSGLVGYGLAIATLRDQSNLAQATDAVPQGKENSS